MNLLDGNKTSEQIRTEIKQEVDKLLSNGLKAPKLVAILVGNNGASLTYVNAKVKSCEAVGFESEVLNFDESISEKELIQEIEKLNNNPDVTGFIVQMPLPKHIDGQKITETIHPEKDVDGFHPTNFGKMALELPTLLPATPYGILELLKRNNIETTGKHCVIVGRSHIVGLPMALLMNKPNNCTVTLTHGKTIDLQKHTLQADILIVATGITEMITGDMVKEGVVVVDVGITRVPDSSKQKGFRLCGDVHFESVSKKASHITPVPGGVGPMTIAALMLNTLKAYKNKL